jgi:hypothetical protein
MAKTDQRNKRNTSRAPTAAAASATSVTDALSLLESFVAAFEPGRYCGEDAAVLVERFSRGEHLCATGKALAAKRATESNLHKVEGARSAAEWLSKKTGETLGAAAGSLHLADQMEDHPGLGDALRSGELSTTRAHQVADVLAVDPNSEDELVEAAKDPNETNRQLADRCLRAKAKARSAEDSLAAYERIRKARYLRHHTDRDGAFRLEGLFTPDAGAKILAALKPTRTVIFDQSRALGHRERPDAYEADALVALLTGERPSAPRASDSSANDNADHADPDNATLADADPADADPPSPQLADDDQADADQASSNANCRPTGFPPPASVHLRVDLAALRRGYIDGGECCEIPGVGPVPIETARSVLGDAIVQLVITKGKDIATVCNLGRSVPVPVQTALNERDLTCVVPGCDVRDGLETDHRVIPFVDGGVTALHNLSKLCHWHHYLKTHKGFRIEGGPGHWQWLPPERPPPEDPDETGSPEADDRLFKPD